MDNRAEHDPRVYFAAERTFLAWIRTGLGLIGIGFAVSRFGLFFPPTEPEQSTFSYACHGAFRLVWGSAGGFGRGGHPQFSLATFSTHSRIEIGQVGTGTRIDGCRGAGTLVGWRRNWHLHLSDPRALDSLLNRLHAAESSSTQYPPRL